LKSTNPEIQDGGRRPTFELPKTIAITQPQTALKFGVWVDCGSFAEVSEVLNMYRLALLASSLKTRTTSTT